MYMYLCLELGIDTVKFRCEQVRGTHQMLLGHMRGLVVITSTISAVAKHGN